MAQARTFFSFAARPHLQSKVIEVNIKAGDQPDPRTGNMADVGSLYMQLHEWQNLRTLLQSGMRDMRQPVGVEIHDGTVRKPKGVG